MTIMKKRISSSKIEQINFGRYYTPEKYIEIARGWLLKHNIGNCAIVDPSCGGGAFFALQSSFANALFMGNDINPEAVQFCSKQFPQVKLFNFNCLLNVSRSQYNLAEEDNLVIVGNPPYNDTTSIVGRKNKSSQCAVDNDIKSRDLGISSILAYEKLKADYACILHPLSYLIKKANFNVCSRFFKNYQMLEHIVFSSCEFDGTSKVGFPVIMALYKRSSENALAYDKVLAQTFSTIEGTQFSLSSRQYISQFIRKYPHHERYQPEILFFTMRDINALKRSQTFMAKRTPHSIDVNPDFLAYYCYADCFKRYAQTPYWMGNFDVPLIASNFNLLANDFVAIAKYLNPQVFGNTEKPPQEVFNRVQDYIKSVVGYQPA